MNRRAGEGRARATTIRATAPGRKLHLGHFAFMRAVLQGLDTRASWERYLRTEGEHDDIRGVRRTIAWIRDEFAAAAKRYARPGTARLVHIDPTSVTNARSAIPSLEDFVNARGLDGFSEAEQLEAYSAEYGRAGAGQSRRERLIAKQLEALAWLESLIGEDVPQPDDPPAYWMHPAIAAHLNDAGILTLRQLVDRVNGKGKRWWSGIDAIGAGKAQRIVEWLRANQASTTLIVGKHVEVKQSRLDPQALADVVRPSTAIVPLEKLIIPPALSGTHGVYRAPARQCRLDADTDLHAVLEWLKAKQGSPARQINRFAPSHGAESGLTAPPLTWMRALSNTQRAYRKETERFLLWSIIERRKALSSLSEDDCLAYAVFLSDPPTAWCAPRSRQKWGPLWRPFEGPLSIRAQRQAITILKSLFKYLVEHGYLAANAWSAVPLPQPMESAASGHGLARTRPSSGAQSTVEMSDTCANRRLSFALKLMAATGLRRSELVSAQVDHLRRVIDDNDAGTAFHWELTVPGRGKTQRTITVPAHVIEALSAYLQARGLHPDPEHAANRGAYLLGKATDRADRATWSKGIVGEIDPKAGIAASTLYVQMREFARA